MTAAVAPGTPAVSSPTAPPASEAIEAPDAAASGLDAVLGDLSEEELAATEPQAPAEGEAPEGEEEPSAELPPDPAQKLDDDVIFSEKALATKDGVLRGKARVLQLRKIAHEKYIELKKFEGRVKERNGKLKASVDKFVSEKRTNQLLLDNVRANLQGLHSGDPDAIMTALGNLTGTDGVRALELLNSRLIHKGRPQLDPQVQALIDQQQQQIEDLRRGFSQRDTQEKVQQATGRIEQHKQAIGQRITGEAAQLPNLARLYADDPQGVVKYIVDDITESASNGTPVDGRTYFVHLEQQLAKHFSAGAPKGDGGGPAPKQPAPHTVQRSPGKSIGPRSAAPSSPREPSEEESLRALADDADLMSSLGL